MPLCKECGSEVAENDQFCPYCGIAMESAAPEEPVDDLAFQSTIMMPPPDTRSAAPANEKPRETAEPEPEQVPAEDDFSDIPTPVALTELENTAGSLFTDAEPHPPATGEEAPVPEIDGSHEVEAAEFGRPVVSDDQIEFACRYQLFKRLLL